MWNQPYILTPMESDGTSLDLLLLYVSNEKQFSTLTDGEFLEVC